MRYLAKGLCALMMTAVVVSGMNTPADALNQSSTKKVAHIAKKYKGIRYNYGGTSPKKGFDCSGYTQFVYRKAVGIHLKRVAGDQAKQGRAIAKSKKRRGDLIAFYNSKGVYHVGIYARDGIIWHASKAGQPVKAEKIWTGSYKVRRFR